MKIKIKSSLWYADTIVVFKTGLLNLLENYLRVEFNGRNLYTHLIQMRNLNILLSLARTGRDGRLRRLSLF